MVFVLMVMASFVLLAKGSVANEAFKITKEAKGEDFAHACAFGTCFVRALALTGLIFLVHALWVS